MSDISVITRLREQRVAAIEGMRGVISRADADGRDTLTGEERQEIERYEATIADLDGQIDLRERAADLQPRLVGRAADEVVERAVTTTERAVATVDSQSYRDAFMSYLRTGETRDMLLAPGSAGGYTVPTTFMNDLIEYRRHYGVIRPMATVMTTAGGEDIQIPSLTAYGSSTWVAEGGAYQESDHTFGQVTFGAYKAGHLIQISEELLQDSALGLESIIARTFGQSVARLEQTAFVTGDGSGKPTGITAASGGASTGVSLGASAITFDNVLDLIHSVTPPYRVPSAAFVMADSTVAYLRKIKTGVASDLRYIWQESAQAGEPPTLFGYRVFVDPDMPAIGTGNKSLAFGDWSFYYIRDAGGMQIQRLNERYADNGLIGFRLWHRLDAKLVDTGAIKLGTHA